jgi:hypothetical protein
MSNLVAHAERELRAAGLFDKDSDYSGMLADAVLELVKVFANQGHSGFSAARTIAIFSRVADGKPLVPLTGADDEWTEVGDGYYQNKRCSRVFRKDGEAYDIEGIVFRDPDGSTWTNKDSHVPIIFPYTPTTKIVDRPCETPCV